MKVVINSCYGGFGLSPEAFEYYLKLKGVTEFTRKSVFSNTDGPPYTYSHDSKDVATSHYEIERNDPLLVKIVKEMGETANGPYAELRVIEIPDNVKWEIDDYDGVETIHEVHRSWG